MFARTPARLAVFLLPLLTLSAQNPTASLTVDAAANRRPINPHIYGVALATPQQLSDLNAPVNRYGGNNTSRYNWQLNADNRGFDWYFQSIPEPSAVAGERGDSFIQNSRSAGATPLLTIPMVGYVAKLGANRAKLASYSISKYGAQTGNDWQWFPDAGNGILSSTRQEITWNDPLDANVPADSAFQQSWAQHLVSRFGTAANGGLRHYILDNEPSLWHSTHRDVHPEGARMEEVRNKILDYAARIKSVDPGALIIGPEEWGWSGYIFSGYDQQYGARNGWSNLPDRTAHANMDYLPWLLQQINADGRRLLDIFTVHYYPQGGEFSNDTSTTMQLRRNRSTRSLWDPTYRDETWIDDYVQLIPRLKTWINNYYPNTPVGITEYNWGAENHINGATAQADIYGIFGREGLDLGARWTTPAANTPTYKAMKLYRNYDGNKSTFGDISVRATGPNPDNLSVFAAERSSDGALTVMVVAKYLSGSTPVNLALQNFSAAPTAQAWQLTAANTITRLPNLSLSAGALSTTVPAQSITLFVLPKAGTVNTPPTAVLSATPTSGPAPLQVTFNGAASSDPDGSISSFAWNFGNGATATGPTPTYTYTIPGTYTATLTVTDNQGATAQATRSISVASDPNLAAPTNLSGTGGKAKYTLTWQDKSTNETGFYVEQAPAGSTTFTRVATLSANTTSYTRSRVSPGTYQLRVQAFNTSTGKLSAYSNTVQLTVR